MLWGLRTVILEHGIQEKIDECCKKFERFEQAFDALQWLLARSPDRGKHRTINGARWAVYVQGVDRLAKTPEIWVLYQYDDDQVTIFGLSALQVENEPENE